MSKSATVLLDYHIKQTSIKQTAAYNELQKAAACAHVACQGMTQKKIASMLGYTETYIGYLLHKRRPWTLKILRKLHAGLTAKSK